MMVTCLAVIFLRQKATAIKVTVIGVNGKPIADAVIGTSFAISDRSPKVQVGYGQPGISVDKNGTASIDRFVLYSNRIVGCDSNGNAGVGIVTKSSIDLTVMLHPCHQIELNFPHPADVKEQVVSYDFFLGDGVVGYGSQRWGSGSVIIPASVDKLAVFNSQCRSGEAKVTPDTKAISVRLAATNWVHFVGKDAPSITPTSIAGLPPHFNLKDLRGKWVLVDFWAVWCQPCVQEMDAIAEFYRTNHGVESRFEILAIHSPDGKSLDGISSNLKLLENEVWHSKPLPFPLIFDYSAATHRRWGVESYPTMLLIDPEGHLVGPASLGDLAKALAR